MIDVKKFAQLARIDISEEELTSLAKDLEVIVAYVSDIEGEGGGEFRGATHTKLTNVMRSDDQWFETGTYTKAILDNVPRSENGYIKVKKIIGSA